MSENDNPFYETENTASATECTGLMPALPVTGAQAADSAALYAVHSPKEKEKRLRAKLKR